MFPGTGFPVHRMWRSGLLLSRCLSRGCARALLSDGRVQVLLPRPVPLPLPLAPQARPYSTAGPRKVVVLGIPNPLIWFRSRIYFFLIRAYFDRDFSIEEFTEGAKQAFTLVSRLLSERKFDALENLVDDEVLKEIQEKCAQLPDNQRDALAADSDEIMYTTPGDVAIYYDDNGRKFVSILMRFWYMTCADLPDENLEGTKVFQVVMGDENAKESKRLLTANYEFRREFSQGVKPDWIITRIEHSKLLD
ncbi:m-AAA protease-interacting protein 1, mitochondrial [Discoglossus pictus]